MQTKKYQFQVEEMQKMAFIGTWDWEIATNNVTWSEELYQIFGLKPREFTPGFESFIEKIHPDDKEKAKTLISQIIKDHQPVNFEMRILRPDGSIRYLDTKTKIISNDLNEPVIAIGLCQDNTEKKQITTLLDNIEDGFYSLDTGDRFTFINKKAEEIMGPFRGNLIGKNLWESFPEAIDTEFYKHFNKAITTQKTQEFEQFSTIQGKWFSIRLLPSGIGTSVYFHDITDKKTATDKLKEEESRFRLLIEAMPQIAWTGDTDNNIDYYNPAWYIYTGLTEGKQKDWDWSNLIHPEDFRDTYPLWQQALKNKEKFELKIRFKRGSDGTYRWHLCRGLPLINDKGEVTKWFGTCTDIDEEVRAEQTQKFLAEAGELLISSIDYKTTLENISKIAVPQFADWCAVDMIQDNQIVRLAVTHHDPAKIELAKEIAKKYPPSLDSPTGVANVIRTGKSEYIKEIPQSLYDAITDPVLKDYAVRLDINSYIVVPLKLNGKPVGGISFVNDKSNRLFDENDLKLAEDVSRRASLALENAELYSQSQKSKTELENTNKELEQFAYVASHDLQEPLRTTTSYASLIAKRYKDKLDQDGQEFLEMIVDASKRMKTLIDDLLDYSKVGKSEFKTVDLNLIIEKILFNLQTGIKENNARVESGPLPVIKAEPTQMLQLFQNLISNSIKYKSDKDPVIKISAKQQENYWLFSVSDNGIGINKEYFDKVFVIFQRLHNREQFEGTGIGLATCKKIVELHNGKIWLESEIGIGTTFFFTIPV